VPWPRIGARCVMTILRIVDFPGAAIIELHGVGARVVGASCLWRRSMLLS
jgi:hypothetical protein